LRPPFHPRRDRREERAHRLNEEIRVAEVRLVGLEDESLNGIVSINRALQLAEEMELDLVEIAAQATPPVCRIVEYAKFLYEQKKREKIAKAKQQVTVLKEIRFGPNTDDHDFDFKLKHARSFLEEGNKVKTYVQFQGRNIVYKDRGAAVLARFSAALDDIAKIEQAPQMEGRRMITILTPRKKA
jgi:translation initiation factor IF-3